MSFSNEVKPAKLYQKKSSVEIRIISDAGEPNFVWHGTARQIYMYVDGSPNPRVIDLRVWPEERQEKK